MNDDIDGPQLHIFCLYSSGIAIIISLSTVDRKLLFYGKTNYKGGKCAPVARFVHLREIFTFNFSSIFHLHFSSIFSPSTDFHLIFPSCSYSQSDSMNEFDIVSKCPTNLTNAVTIWCGQLEDVFVNLHV